VTHLENAADEREEEDCSRLVQLMTEFDLLRSFTPELHERTSIEQTSAFTLMNANIYVLRDRNQQMILSTRIL